MGHTSSVARMAPAVQSAARHPLMPESAPIGGPRSGVIGGSAPAFSKRARTASASPPSVGSGGPAWPRSAKACNVPSGIMLTVSRAASASMCRVFEASGSLRPGAGPEQPLRQRAALRERPEARRCQQLSVCAIGQAADRDAEAVAQLGRHAVGDRFVPAAHERRSDRSDARVEPRLDPALDAAQAGIGRRDLLLAREQQRHVDGNAGEDRLFDRRNAFCSPRDLHQQDLHQQVRPLGLGAGGSALRLRSIRSCRRRAEGRLPSRPSRRRPSWRRARAGTHPPHGAGPRARSRRTGPRRIRAPVRVRGSTNRRRRSLRPIAWSKIVGFDVSSVTVSSSMSRCSVPSRSMRRVTFSSHRLCPSSWSFWAGFMDGSS